MAFFKQQRIVYAWKPILNQGDTEIKAGVLYFVHWLCFGSICLHAFRFAYDRPQGLVNVV